MRPWTNDWWTKGKIGVGWLSLFQGLLCWMSFCGCDWSEHDKRAGHLFGCGCEPCCGDPCNPLSALYCLLCFTCCGPCVTCKWYASQLDQPCAMFNHVFLGYCMLYGFLRCFMRYNARMEAGVWDDPDSCDKIFGDWFLTCCCCTSTCATFQELRSVPREHWDCMSGDCVCCLTEIRLVRRPPGGKSMA